MGAETDALPFDRVVVSEGGRRRVLQPDELLALPLDVRVRWLLSGNLEFRRGDKIVDRREALAALRKL